MRLFAIYNRAYKLRYVLAPSISDALTLATQAGHIKRPQQYRKWLDLTDNPPADIAAETKSLLAADHPGMLTPTSEGWTIGSFVLATAMGALGAAKHLPI